MLTHLAHPTRFSELHFEFESALRLKMRLFFLKKCQKTHCENQSKVQSLAFSFLALPVTHLRSIILTVPLQYGIIGHLLRHQARKPDNNKRITKG